MLSLAFSVYSNKGVYALLLGSGVSRAAAIPTGWEIVLDLIQKMARLGGEERLQDPEAWFTAKYQREPNYSELLEALAHTQAERKQMLQAYFEPTEEEREQGLKLPTPAHKAIAELVLKGYVRVILTTNFDRLMESALAEAGIEPTVIYTADAAQGALPLAHARCTLVKLHGDYLDTRIKNTRRELEEYEPALDSLVDRVLDEYGLIVCGWSAEWDVALRAAMERCQSHRFTTYWTEKDPLKDAARSLVSLRRATVIKIDDANSFFQRLRDTVFELETIGAQHPLSSQVAVGQLKRYLERPEHLIRLSDLVERETKQAYEALFGSRLPIPGSGFSLAELPGRIDACERLIETLKDLMICLARWGKEQHRLILQQAFRRVASPPRPRDCWSWWVGVLFYPAFVLLYAVGLSAIAADNYGNLAALLHTRLRWERDERETDAACILGDVLMTNLDLWKHLPDGDRARRPLSDHLWEVLGEPLRAQQLPDDRDYEEAFDWFEYLLALVYCDLRMKAGRDVRGPIGRFGWRVAAERSRVVHEAQVREGEAVPTRVRLALEAGLFAGGQTNISRYTEVKTAFDNFLVEAIRGWW